MKPFFRNVLAQNTLWMFLGQGLRLVISAAYFVVIARSLGAYNYGAFVGVVALVGIVFPFGALGSGSILVKNVARDKSLFRACWGRVLAITTVASSVLFLVVLLLARYTLPSEIPLNLVLLVTASDLFFLSIIWVCGQAFQAFEQLQWTAVTMALISGTRLVGAIILVQFHPHPSGLQWGLVYFCSTIAVATISFLLVSVKLGLPTFSVPRSVEEIREGFYFSASLGAQTVYNDIDKAMLARMGPLDAVGIYGAAYRLLDAAMVPVGSLRTAAYPNFFRTGETGISGALPYANRLARRALGWSAIISVGLLLGAGVVPYVLGPEYARTVEALRWLALLPILRALHYFYSDALSGAGHQGLRTSIQAGVAAFNVLINLWLIPAYSWRGAAWSSIASDALLAAGVVLAVWILHRRPIPVRLKGESTLRPPSSESNSGLISGEWLSEHESQ
jgi:O-antigen/teichoic acid export membrane protein